MKFSHWGLVLLAVGLVVGMLVAGGVPERNAEAQGVPISPPPAPFQITAWAFSGSQVGSGQRGCYIVDTVTGELWHAAADGQPKKISEKVR